jgi:hypothetical protein
MDVQIDGKVIPVFRGNKRYKTEIIALNERSLKIFTFLFYGELVNEDV